MEIWYDSADTTQIAPIAEQGWITGVTTNPRILSAQAVDAAKQIAQLLDIQTGYVAVQVTASDDKGIIAQAKRLHALSDRIVVKVPVTAMGLKSIPELTKSNIPTLATAVFNAEQFLLVAKMGVQYVAPYMTQMQQHGIDVFSEIEAMQEMIDHYGFATKVMAASIQSIQDLKMVARLGVAAATLFPPRFTEWLATHTLTGEFTKAFDECWAPFAKQYAGSLFAPH